MAARQALLLALLVAMAPCQLEGKARRRSLMDLPNRSLFGDYLSSFYASIEERFAGLEASLSKLPQVDSSNETARRLLDLEARLNSSSETEQRLAALEAQVRRMEERLSSLFAAKLDATEQRLEEMVRETSDATERRLAAVETTRNATTSSASVCRYQYQYKFQTLASSQTPADSHRLERLEGELSRLQERLAAISQRLDQSDKGVLALYNATSADHERLVGRMSDLLGASESRVISMLQIATEITAKSTADLVKFTKADLMRKLDRTAHLSRRLMVGLKEELFARLDNSSQQVLANISSTLESSARETGTCKPKPEEETCMGYMERGQNTSGVYTLKMEDGLGPLDVFCDMTTDGGGWVVFQRRLDGSVDFYRNWTQYERGFGNPSAEFWLGNRNLHRLTSAGLRQLRVELEDWNSERVYALYSNFSVGDADSSYTLTVSGYSGTAGDALETHDGQAFSTLDQDNDPYEGHCAQVCRGGWWYNTCLNANLNGLYGSNVTSSSKYVVWYHFRSNQSLRLSEMKMR